MSDSQSTIDFLTDKVKRLELDVQYELHRANQAQEKYDNLKSVVFQKLNEILHILESSVLS